ncbi:MAG: hypothetical protein ACJA0N_001570 [Pseudohongiellaceae bacterium]|jgi:uncharacterized protein (TIGR01777 family)
MNILISGGTGFIGTALCSHLTKKDHNVVVITRYPELLGSKMKGVNKSIKIPAEQDFDVVINLAGEPIANKRWSKSQKRKILESRLDITEQLIAYFREATNKPALFISGSAIGYYGIGETNEAIDEDCMGDDSFSSSLCTQWEESAMQAESLGIRTCILRTGIVLGKNGGALAKMLPPFKLGLGGKIGTGKQWMPWIHLNDVIGIIGHCINDKTLKGPINCTAPYPVTNTVFTEVLGQLLKRPTVCQMPVIVIKLLMGQMGKELLLAGKKVVPFKVQRAGYQFQYEAIESALSDILTTHR